MIIFVLLLPYIVELTVTDNVTLTSTIEAQSHQTKAESKSVSLMFVIFSLIFSA